MPAHQMDRWRSRPRLDALPIAEAPGQLAPLPEQPEAAERRLAQPPDDLRRLLLEPRDELLDLAGLRLVELVAGLEDLAGEGGGLGGAAAVHPPGGVDGGLAQVALGLALGPEVAGP